MKKADHISAQAYKSLKSEHDIQTEISNYLTAIGYKVMRINSGGIPYEYTYKKGLRKGTTKKGKVRLAEPGTPDLEAFKGIDHEGIDLIFIEVKKPGEVATDLQLAKHDELRSYGARVITVRSVEEVQKQL